jgi:malonyl CoA-acyl carrier protein transacylase
VGHGDVLTKIAAAIRDQTPAPVAAAKRDEDVSQLSVAGKVTAWNGRHSVGARVRSLNTGYGDLETRTPAVVLFNHRAAIYMKGYEGYFDLDEVVPI